MKHEHRPQPGKGSVRAVVERVRDFLTRGIWSMELAGLPAFRAAFLKVSRVVLLALRGFVQDRCLFRASALTYITVLSLVPLLAFAFSVAKGLGAYDTLLNDTVYPFLDETFGVESTLDESGGEGVEAGQDVGGQDAEGQPEGSGLQGSDTAGELRGAIDTVLDFVQKTNFASLGIFGLLILAYTALKLLGSIEQSFNEIWGVHKPRSFLRKVADYTSILMIVPILLVAGTAVSAVVQTHDPFSLFDGGENGQGPSRSFLDLYGQVTALVAIWVGFAFTYLFMPNTRVRVFSALIGGVIGGTLWRLSQVAHVDFQVGMAKYNAIYSTFAAFPIFLFWIWASWVTVLLGAEFAYAHQNEPAYRQIARAREHGQDFKELLAMRVMARIAIAFLNDAAPQRPSQLAETLGAPERSVEEVLGALREARILVSVEDEVTPEPTLLPARDLEHITVAEVQDAIRGVGGAVDFPPSDAMDREVDDVLSRFAEERVRAAHNLNMRELAEASHAGAQVPVAPAGHQRAGATGSTGPAGQGEPAT